MRPTAAEEEHGETPVPRPVATASIQRETRACGTPGADKCQDAFIALAYEKWVTITPACISIMISSSSLPTRCEELAVVLRQMAKPCDL